jgi:hypothetical protein
MPEHENTRLLRRLTRAGARVMHDSDQHEVLAIRSAKLGEFVAEMEREALHRFFSLTAEAMAQALHLNATRGGYVLREWVTQQLFGSCRDLEEVAALIERRRADQSDRMERLRSLFRG